MTTVHIEPDGGSVEYTIALADGATPGELTSSKTYYADLNRIVGYTTYWPVTIEVDGGVEAVHADGATITIDGDAVDSAPAIEEVAYGEGGYGGVSG